MSLGENLTTSDEIQPARFDKLVFLSALDICVKSIVFNHTCLLAFDCSVFLLLYFSVIFWSSGFQMVNFPAAFLTEKNNNFFLCDTLDGTLRP